MMKINENSVQYQVPTVKIIKLSLDSGAICVTSNSEKLEEEEGTW